MTADGADEGVDDQRPCPDRTTPPPVSATAISVTSCPAITAIGTRIRLVVPEPAPEDAAALGRFGPALSVAAAEESAIADDKTV